MQQQLALSGAALERYTTDTVPASSKELCSPPSPTTTISARLPEELATCAGRKAHVAVLRHGIMGLRGRLP